jgi:hypothetical protein
VRLALHSFQQTVPFSDAIALRTLQADVRCGRKQPILQVLTKAVGNG